jgi:hypothetical protein
MQTEMAILRCTTPCSAATFWSVKCCSKRDRFGTTGTYLCVLWEKRVAVPCVLLILFVGPPSQLLPGHQQIVAQKPAQDPVLRAARDRRQQSQAAQRRGGRLLTLLRSPLLARVFCCMIRLSRPGLVRSAAPLIARAPRPLPLSRVRSRSRSRALWRRRTKQRSSCSRAQSSTRNSNRNETRQRTSMSRLC